MNIFGEGFPTQIDDQIVARQRIYGAGYFINRTQEELNYLNNKTAWVKLTSGVDVSSSISVNNPTISSLGLNGPELAKRYVLFNGTVESPGFLNRFRGGVADQNDFEGTRQVGLTNSGGVISKPAAYGIGGTEFGLNPMMGILSANIKHENKGSLRRAEVKIKAWNKHQFEIIDALYLRLGFTVLLEWGHSIVVDNTGSFYPYGSISPYNTFSTPFLNQNQVNYDTWLKSIYDKRLATSGNYDAMLATVSNFTWSFNPDGSYDITVKLISIGDLIESLKVNVLTASPDNFGLVAPQYNVSNQNPDTFDEGRSGDIINAFAYSSTIGNFLYTCKEFVDNYSTIQGGQSTKISTGLWANIFGSINIYTAAYINPSDTNQFNARYNSIINNSNKSCIQFNINYFDRDQEDILKITFDDIVNQFKSADDDRYYIRLGAFLNFLQSYIVPTVWTKGNNKYPHLRFDTDINTNVFNLHPWQAHVDPRICFVNREIDLTIPNVGGPLVFGVFNNPTNPIKNKDITDYVKSKQNTDKIEYGNIMNIYLDTTFILKTMVSFRDDKGDLALIDFLKALLAGVNEGLGGLNDFDVFIDETQNMIKIIDKNPLNYVNDVIDAINSKFPSSIGYNNNSAYNTPSNPNAAVLQVYGYNGSQAGFVSDLNLTTELSSNFSTMISVGATSRGSVVGENDTALSKLNYGFEDRFKHTISNSPSLLYNNTAAPYDATDLVNREKELDQMRKDYIGFLFKLSNGTATNPSIIEAETEDINNFKLNLKSLIQKATEVDVLSDAINGTTTTISNQGTGFLPFNLSLTLDGISGIKINQQFLIDTRFLPTNYPDTMRFLIRNLSHEIKDNKWTTKIETYAIPEGTNTGNASSLYKNIVISGPPLPPPPPTPTPTPTPTPGTPSTAKDKNYSLCGLPTTYSHIDGNSGKASSNDNKGQWRLVTSWIRDPADPNDAAKALVRSAYCHENTPTYDIYNTQGGVVGCAAAVSLIFYRATGYNIISTYTKAWEDDKGKFPGDLGTYTFYDVFYKSTSWLKIPVASGQPGDIVLTPRLNKQVAGHVGVVVDKKMADGTFGVVSNGSGGFAGVKYKISLNYSLGDGGGVIAGWTGGKYDVSKRNPSKTFCWRYKGGLVP